MLSLSFTIITIVKQVEDSKMKVKKTIILAVAALCLTSFLFAGCTAKSEAVKGNNKSKSQRSFNKDDMKKRVEDSIKSLIDDKTITKEQGDKIVEAYTNRTGGQGRGNRQGNPQNGQNNQGTQNGQDNQNGQNNQGTQNGQNGNNQGRQRFNPLSKLVSDGTITQAQCDAVLAKLRGNISRN